MSTVDQQHQGLQNQARGATFTTRLHERIATSDHKKLGVMYVTAGLIFFLIGGFEASMMRWQLAWPGLNVVGPKSSIACSPCTERPWSSWSACPFCWESPTTSCRS